MIYPTREAELEHKLKKAVEALGNMHRFLAEIEGFLQSHGMWGDEEQDLLEANERTLTELEEVKT